MGAQGRYWIHSMFFKNLFWFYFLVTFTENIFPQRNSMLNRLFFFFLRVYLHATHLRCMFLFTHSHLGWCQSKAAQLFDRSCHCPNIRRAWWNSGYHLEGLVISEWNNLLVIGYFQVELKWRLSSKVVEEIPASDSVSYSWEILLF